MFFTHQLVNAVFKQIGFFNHLFRKKSWLNDGCCYFRNHEAVKIWETNFDVVICIIAFQNKTKRQNAESRM